MNLDELVDAMERDELDDAEFLTPIEFAKLIGVRPQLVYYHIRKEHIDVFRCPCGRKVVHVASATEALSAQARLRQDLCPPAGAARMGGSGTHPAESLASATAG